MRFPVARKSLSLIALCPVNNYIVSDTLADRLSADPNYTLEATLCYICSGNVAELLECWQSANSDDTSSPLQLQVLILFYTLFANTYHCM